MSIRRLTAWNKIEHFYIFSGSLHEKLIPVNFFCLCEQVYSWEILLEKIICTCKRVKNFFLDNWLICSTIYLISVILPWDSLTKQICFELLHTQYTWYQYTKEKQAFQQVSLTRKNLWCFLVHACMHARANKSCQIETWQRKFGCIN